MNWEVIVEVTKSVKENENYEVNAPPIFSRPYLIAHEKSKLFGLLIYLLDDLYELNIGIPPTQHLDKWLPIAYEHLNY